MMPTSPKNSSDGTPLPPLDTRRLRYGVAILRALHHPLRQRIVMLLSDFESLTVTQIFVDLRIEQSVASQHLAILRKVDLVLTHRQGKYVHYALDHDRLATVMAAIDLLYPSTEEE